MDCLKKQLFCLPYAGGNTYVYNKWKRKTSEDVEVVPIEYSGHGMRINEELIADFDKFVDDICMQLRYKKRDVPFGIFGYSMGAKMCMRVAERMYDLIGQKPSIIFVGASQPPHIADDREWNSDDELKEILYKYGGMPKEVMESDELMDLFFPIIKNDIMVCDQIGDNRESFKCDNDIVVFYSDVDNKAKKMEEWNEYTSGECELFKFDGSHFFVNEHEDEIVNIINKKWEEIWGGEYFAY